MIYTLTVNPAIDYHMDLTGADLRVGAINRSAGEAYFPGGKGLNVSVVLSRLGIASIAWGFVAGKTGRMLEELAAEKGCSCDFIRLPGGETRINVKLDCARETAVNGSGPVIEQAQIDELLARVRKLSADDMLILSGNLQAGSVNLYEAVCREAAGRGTALIVDTEGESLRSTLSCRPFLIKPNEEELLQLYGAADGSEEGIIGLMRRCRDEGAANILVTRGGDGALLLTEEGGLYRAVITRSCEVISTVGAGDSTIAGFLAGLARYGTEYEKVLQMACAAGTATAGRKWLGSREDTERLLPFISVTRL